MNTCLSSTDFCCSTDPTRGIPDFKTHFSRELTWQDLVPDIPRKRDFPRLQLSWLQRQRYNILCPRAPHGLPIRKPNFAGLRIPVSSGLNVPMWRHFYYVIGLSWRFFMCFSRLWLVFRLFSRHWTYFSSSYASRCIDISGRYSTLFNTGNWFRSCC